MTIGASAKGVIFAMFLSSPWVLAMIHTTDCHGVLNGSRDIVDPNQAQGGPCSSQEIVHSLATVLLFLLHTERMQTLTFTE